MWIYEKPDNLVEWWNKSLKQYSNNTLFWIHDASGKLNSMTYAQVGDRIDSVRSALDQINIKKDDSVGVICSNRPEWAIISYATYGRNAKFIPMYEKELVKTWKYIIQDSKIKVLFVANRKIYEKIKAFKDEIESLENIYILDEGGDYSFNDFENTGKNKYSAPLIPHYDDIAVLIYTSGTTGDPKGVLLSHGNLTYVSESARKMFSAFNEKQVSLSILPWAHSYGLSAELNNWINFGGSIGFLRDVSTLFEDMQIIRPTYLIAVPKLFNKIYNGIQNKMLEVGGVKKFLFDKACSLGKKKMYLSKMGKSNPILNFEFFLLDKIVLQKIKNIFGGRLAGAITGSAAMNKEVGEFFNVLSIPIYDCYGLSETAPAITISSPSAVRLGSVGKVIHGQRVVIDRSVVEPDAKDGEIVIYGPNIMKGYQNKPEETKKVMTADGGFRTGDRGRFDEDGFLWITGRIKEQYKLENGKYVFPAAIEEEIKLLPEIVNAVIFGADKPFNICLLVPDFTSARMWAQQKNISDSIENLLSNKNFTCMLEEKITSQLKKKFGGYEIPQKFIFLKEDFSVENGTLTQTMKLKRNVILKEYKEQIDNLYK
jgi:long-chain acyl-CoA synthetase